MPLPIIAALGGAASSFFGGDSAPAGPNTSGGAFAPSGMIIGPKVVGRGNATQNADNRASATQVPSDVPAAAGVVNAPGMMPRNGAVSPTAWLESPVVLWSAIGAAVLVVVVLLFPSKRKK